MEETAPSPEALTLGTQLDSKKKAVWTPEKMVLDAQKFGFGHPASLFWTPSKLVLSTFSNAFWCTQLLCMPVQVCGSSDRARPNVPVEYTSEA